MIRQVPRKKSRRNRVCATCLGRIVKGDSYLSMVASPYHDDLGNANWWRLDECKNCASTYGRWAPITERAGT